MDVAGAVSVGVGEEAVFIEGSHQRVHQASAALVDTRPIAGTIGWSSWPCTATSWQRAVGMSPTQT